MPSARRRRLLVAALVAPVTLAAGAAGAAPTTHALAVKPGARLEVDSHQVAVTVRPGARGAIKVVADLRGGLPGDGLELTLRGDTVTVDGLGPMVSGKVAIEVPPGTRMEVSSVVGAIDVVGRGGRAELETVSGAVTVVGLDEVDVDSVSGGVTVRGATAIDVESVSGAVTLAPRGAAARVDVESVSGGLALSGACGAGCRFRIETLSGAIDLALDRKSSFGLRHESFSGKLDDGLPIVRTHGEEGDDGRELAGRYGKGEGSIAVESFSGRTRLRPLAAGK